MGLIRFQWPAHGLTFRIRNFGTWELNTNQIHWPLKDCLLITSTDHNYGG